MSVQSTPQLINSIDSQNPSTSSRLRVVPDDVFLRDSNNRAWLLRGVNLSGSCKFPRYPVPVPSNIGGKAFLEPRSSMKRVGENGNSTDGAGLKHADEHVSNLNEHAHVNANEMSNRNEQAQQSATQEGKISFVGRPFELEEADEHLARLRHWGFRMIRWVVTWEAIEHQGPGIYDQEFLDYTVKALLKAKEYGFKVMIDFHQDVWSRFSGGSGAPLWTFYAAGLDPHHFAATGAAFVHNTLQEHEPLLRMAWLTNYYKLACASMFTLFYAGKTLAPKCTFENGVNIQDYLQSHFLGSIKALVDRIHECRDGEENEGKNLLEDEVVIGYDSWNEPSCGWIGLERLDILPEQHDMRQGDMPTPLQSLMLGEGLVVRNVATYRLELIGPVKSGSRTIDPSAHPTSFQEPVKAWLSPSLREELDLKYGFQRDSTFPKAGECLWAQHGVWSIKDRKVLQQDYFARGPSAKPIHLVPDHWLSFAKRVTEVVRQVHPTAILFLEPPVYVPPPDFVSRRASASPQCEDEDNIEAVLTSNMVYTPHHYDDLVLLTKKYLGWINIDLLGLSRGRHKSLLGSIVLGKKSTEALFGSQIDEIQKECYERLGQRPVLIGETGLHFDVGLDEAERSGDMRRSDKKKQGSSLSLPWIGSKRAMNPPDRKPKTASISKQFQQAFDNILNGLDRTMVHYTLWNYTIENDAQFGDGWNGENLSLYSLNSVSASASENSSDNAYHKLNRGGRAIEQFCRPYPIATVGNPIKIRFDRHKKSFELRTRTTIEKMSEVDPVLAACGTVAKTEVYVPRFHFPGPEHCIVKVSDGSWEWDTEKQIVYWIYEDSENREVIDHWMTVTLSGNWT
ncbi:hypothetical protein BGZ79_008486 [Entomortierella chlamydospora]|nr:hypothetical protein BGZ79_008486 [Entomortierella chlamydospora]